MPRGVFIYAQGNVRETQKKSKTKHCIPHPTSLLMETMFLHHEQEVINSIIISNSGISIRALVIHLLL